MSTRFTALCLDEGTYTTKKLEENLREILSYLASEALKARKMGRIDRAKRLTVAFKILSDEYEKIRLQDKGESQDHPAARARAWQSFAPYSFLL